MLARIIKITGGEVVDWGRRVKRPAPPPIPNFLPISCRWDERREAFEGQYNKLIRPTWVSDLISGKLPLADTELRAVAYWMGAVLSWFEMSREEILKWCLNMQTASLGEKTLRRAINAGYSAEKYGRR